jgi:hypothetical protein
MMSLAAGWEAVRRRRLDEAYRRAQRMAAEAQSEMKAAHPWTNRSGNAEEALYCVASRSVRADGSALIAIDAGYRDDAFDETEPHGQYLELANGGVWGVVRPTMAALRRAAVRELSGVLRGAW